MNRAMHHRGPDDEGIAIFHGSGSAVDIYGGDDTPDHVFMSGNSYCPGKKFSGEIPQNTHLALGHRRLSIIDLSAAGHQPMCTEDQRFWIVYNGEVYNYKELRSELKTAGESFFSNSDTEVVLKAFRHWGPECLNRFNGMWAFAIWDSKKKQLFCSRDRIGIKPFYYHVTDSYLIFASDIKTLIASKLYRPVPNWEGVYHAMSFQCAPRPMTCFSDVVALAPAHWMTVDMAGKINQSRFWRIPTGNMDYNRTEKQWVRDLDETLKRSVEQRLISDVPIGTFMSGGIDSTTISAIAAQKHNGIKTFTLSYGNRYPEMNELVQAKATARMWPLSHIWKEVDPECVLPEIHNITKCYEEPALSLGPIYVISQLVRDSSVTVVLNGLGPDELFCGYGRHAYLSLWNRIRPFKTLLSPISGMSDKLGKLARLSRCTDVFDYYVNMVSAFPESLKKQLFAIPDARAWSSGDTFKKIYELGEIEFESLLEAICYMDLVNYIGNHHVYRGDQFSMHFSIECRYPYLDYKFVELSSRVPDRFRVRNGYGKYIQRKLSEKYVHSSCLEMKKKGFSFPIAGWMRTQLKDLVHEKIDRLKARDVFNPYALDQIRNYFYLKNTSGNQLWFLVSIELWLEELIDAQRV